MKAKSALIVFLLVFFSLSFVKSALAAEVLINEFIPNPGTGNSEWVEFYNTTNSAIDLSDYYFDDDSNFDSDSGSSAKISLAGLLLPVQTCFWELSSYLNNNGDSPTIFKIGNNTPLDTYTYASSSAGLTYARIPDGGEWVINQTPSKSFNKCIDLVPTLTSTPVPTQTPTSKPTNSPMPTVTNTPTLTKAISKTPTPTEIEFLENKDVLGNATDSSTQSINLSKEEKIENIKSINNFLPLIFISIGIVFLLACAIVFFYPKIKIALDKNE